MERIVVGIDGSQGSRRALQFALREAKRRGAVLQAVTAWHVPTMAYGGGLTPVAIDAEDFRKAADGLLDEALREIAGELEGVQVERVVGQGQPAQVLVEQARGADLLVVGTRGHGGFAELVLGSVSHQCAHHAPCPLVIVPAPQQAT